MKKTKLVWAIGLTIWSSVSLYAQADSVRHVFLEDVVIKAKSTPRSSLSTQVAEHISQEDLHLHMGHSLVEALSHTAGVQAMDIGVGFSKPMIRGLAFQRIAVTENGIKQEGQQWGADHGLEVDAFHVEAVRIIKGPASILYGSDALGGVVEILPPSIPRRDTVYGDITLRYESVSTGLSASAKIAFKHKGFFASFRYTERHWADYRVPADSFTYIGMRLAIPERRLKNTAGVERSGNGMLHFQHGAYKGDITISNSYQRSGFFSGAHGIPNSASLANDSNHWNIDLPYSWVNHFKITSQNSWTKGFTQTTLTVGYQLNHREEWSAFHTHTFGQQPPAIDPDKELMFHLHTGSASLQVRLTPNTNWEHYFSLSGEYQHNSVGGYGFLIPNYVRAQAGISYFTNWHPTAHWTVSAALRYDWGYIHSQRHAPLVTPVQKHFHDYALALGFEYNPTKAHKLTMHIGRAYRLPSVNELSSNGVHHGAFRHEEGDSTLCSEQGWQADLSYCFQHERAELSFSPFVSYYTHFIALQPTGLWSELPDAGQIYRYTDAPAVFVGGEIKLKVRLFHQLYYTLSAEYVHTYNTHTHTALPFSPPATIRNTFSWESRRWQIFAECQGVTPQYRVCHNEDKTPGYALLNAGGSVRFPFRKMTLTLMLHGKNLINTAYYNHLSFYRKLDLPEAGINIQTTIRLTF